MSEDAVKRNLLAGMRRIEDPYAHITAPIDECAVKAERIAKESDDETITELAASLATLARYTAALVRGRVR